MLIGQSPLMLLFKVAIYDLKVKVSRGKYTVQKYKKKKITKKNPHATLLSHAGVAKSEPCE